MGSHNLSFSLTHSRLDQDPLDGLLEASKALRHSRQNDKVCGSFVLLFEHAQTRLLTVTVLCCVSV